MNRITSDLIAVPHTSKSVIRLDGTDVSGIEIEKHKGRDYAVLTRPFIDKLEELSVKTGGQARAASLLSCYPSTVSNILKGKTRRMNYESFSRLEKLDIGKLPVPDGESAPPRRSQYVTPTAEFISKFLLFAEKNCICRTRLTRHIKSHTNLFKEWERGFRSTIRETSYIQLQDMMSGKTPVPDYVKSAKFYTTPSKRIVEAQEATEAKAPENGTQTDGGRKLFKSLLSALFFDMVEHVSLTEQDKLNLLDYFSKL